MRRLRNLFTLLAIAVAPLSLSAQASTQTRMGTATKWTGDSTLFSVSADSTNRYKTRALLMSDLRHWLARRAWDSVATVSLRVTGLTDLSGASAGQIKFPVTANTTTDTTVLDAYRFGTWTPIVGGSATYSAQAGRYVRIGKQVTVWGDFTINAIGSGSQSTISGLPFASSSGNPAGALCSIPYFTGLASSVVYINAYVNAGTTNIVLNSLAAAATSITNAPNLLTSSTRIVFACTYTIQ